MPDACWLLLLPLLQRLFVHRILIVLDVLVVVQTLVLAENHVKVFVQQINSAALIYILVLIATHQIV